MSTCTFECDTYQRHDTESVNTPPIKGAVIVATAYVAPMKLWYAGLFARGVIMVMVTNAPLKIPAEPAPERARPTMNATDVGATADIREPTSKMNSAARKVSLVEHIAYIFPKRGTRAAAGRLKAEPYLDVN